MQGNQHAAGHGGPVGNKNKLGHTRLPQVPSPDGSRCIRPQCNKELASSWRTNQNGVGYACVSCYVHFGTGKLAKAAADPKQPAITQFFKKQKQQGAMTG